jgi:polysaccharide biosynthesis protein PslG
MIRRPRKPAACLALALLAALVPGAHAKVPSGAHAAASSLAVGVNIGFNPGAPGPGISREIALAHALHAQVVRVSVPWYVFEPVGPQPSEPGPQAALAELLEDAQKRGIRVIVTVDGTPCWASSAPPSLMQRCSPRRGSAAHAWPPQNPAAYAAFVAFLARRYGGSGLAAIEIWNEPDQSNQEYFAGPDKVQRYAAVLRAAYPAIKQANSSVLVLGGSLVGPRGLFLKALYAAGIKGYYDALAVHFYTLTVASLRAIHEVQLANGDGTPLWLDEFGWSSCYPRRRIEQEQACVTTSTQAANLANTIHAIARLPYVSTAVVYKMQDSSGEQFGVLTAGGARKPSFAALAGAFADPLGPVQPVTVQLRRSGRGIVASGSGPVGEYMELEAFDGGLLRYKAIFVLDRFNRYTIALPSVLGTRDLSVEVYPYGVGSARAAHAGI